MVLYADATIELFQLEVDSKLLRNTSTQMHGQMHRHTYRCHTMHHQMHRHAYNCMYITCVSRQTYNPKTMPPVPTIR